VRRLPEYPLGLKLLPHTQVARVESVPAIAPSMLEHEVHALAPASEYSVDAQSAHFTEPTSFWRANLPAAHWVHVGAHQIERVPVSS
jgi:hypothetical protein